MLPSAIVVSCCYVEQVEPRTAPMPARRDTPRFCGVEHASSVEVHKCAGVQCFQLLCSHLTASRMLHGRTRHPHFACLRQLTLPADARSLV